MLQNTLLKLNNLFSGGIKLSSVFAAEGDVVNTFDATDLSSGLFSVITEWLISLIVKIIYNACIFVMSLIDLMQYAVMAMLGIDVSIDDYVLIDYNNPLIKIISSESFTKAFRYIIGIAIILVIIFTIFSIIKSEYNFAANDGPFVSKSRIFSRSLRSFFIMGIFPMIFLFAVIMINAILAGFNDILKTENKNTSIAAQIFVTSAYNANNYRRYADANSRIPISINFEDPISLGQEAGYTTEQLRDIYSEFEEQGKTLYNDFANLDFGTFSDTITYRNNKVVNQSSYNGYENFFCTREQYYVMADFMDYAVKSNLNYYVKNIADTDIDWGYVDETIFNKDEGTLTITYRDTDYLNNGESYTIVYAPDSLNISTPISDALDTISALLGIGEYSDNTFNILNRLEESINVVEWETDKAWIQFSKDLAISGVDKENVEASETISDQIIFYEKYKYRYNNTLNYTIDELCQGVELPVYKLEKRQYQASISSFIVYEEYYVVEINGTYYVVEENKNLTDKNGNLLVDDYGDYYYTLVEPVTSTTFSEEVNDDYKTYKKQTSQAWSEITTTKSSGTYEIVVEAEPLCYDNNGDGDFDDVGENFDKNYNSKWDEGEDFIDVNGNGYWDAEYSYYVIYDDHITASIKQISWPQKLINDLQVIYSDININHLITTNKWLEQLGEYTSNGNSTSSTNNISTAIIHPLGLIMSEFFLGVIEDADNTNSYGATMFSSKFDEDTIKALELSLMGEENYFQLKAELEYFCEMFNVFMGPVLDEIAYYENFELRSGNDASVQLYTYKAYLASVMLSASTAEWMYDTANKLLGNANFSREIYYSDYNSENFGEYKPFSEFKTDCEICGGDGVKDDGTDCTKTGCLESTAYEIIKLFEAQKANLKNQDVHEDDPAYPEYMRALEEYIYGDFDGRQEIVLSSNLSSIAKEKQMVLAYNEIKAAYDKIMAACDSDELKKQINNIIYIPNAIYVAVDRKGNEYTLDSVPSDVEIVAFKNKGSKDAFTMKETASATQELTSEIQRLKNIIEAQDIAKECVCSDDSCLKCSLDEYYSKIENYIPAKLSYLEEDMSHSLSGQRNKLVVDLALKEGLFDAAALFNENGLNIINAVKEIKTQEAWEKFKAGWLDFDNDGDYDNVSGLVQVVFGQNYINARELIDRLDRYNITFGINNLYSQNTDIQFDVTVNNKTYNVGQNFTQAKFIEYVMGSKYLNDLDYETVFVDDDYNGLVTLDGTGKLVGSFNTLTDFLVELGDISATVYEMTNFVNLSSNAQDELKIGVQEINLSGVDLTNTEAIQERLTDCGTNLSKYILQWILSDDENYLAQDLICALFGIDPEEVSREIEKIDKQDGFEYKYHEKTFATFEEAYENAVKNEAVKLATTSDVNNQNRILNNVLSYLFLTDTDSSKKNYVDYSKLTLQDIRLKAFDFLINYEEQEGESAEQNQKRYLAVFALACADWYTLDGEGGKLYADNNSWKISRKSEIIGLGVSKQSQATVLRLAGLENRPYEELVGAEYTINFDRNGVDEANGDVFIICTYDDTRQIYIPFLMGNTTKYGFDENKGYELVTHPTTDNTWQADYGYYETNTQYYMEEKFYPVVAKGFITSDGLPTAIRQVGDDIEYYRDNVIIHDVSDIGLSTYYVSMDQITVNHTAISYVANAFSKLFTGKSLVENIASKIPKFAANSDYKFCYGTERNVIEKSFGGSVYVDYNFDKSICISMENLYKMDDINLLILVIGAYTLFIAIWKALWGVTQRIFDVAVLYLVGPAVISTISLRTDSTDDDGNIIESDTDAYSNWKKTLLQKLLNVFSYAVGFNIFFLITPIISNINLFASQIEYNAALSFSSIFKYLNVNFVNEIGRLVLLIAAAYLCTRGTDLFAKILSIEDAFKVGNETFSNVKNTVSEVADHISGQYMIDKVEGAVDNAKQFIPGYAIAKEVAGKVKEVGTKVASKAAESYMIANGVPPSEAERLSKALEDKIKQKDKIKKERKKNRTEAREKREKARSGGK